MRIRPSSAEGDPFCALQACFSESVQVSTSLFPQRRFQHHHSGPHHMRIVLAREACVGPNTQDRAEHLVATTGHLIEEMMATFHPPGVAGGWHVQWALRASRGDDWPPLRRHDAQLGVMATCRPPGGAGKRRIVADTARVEAGCP